MVLKDKLLEILETHNGEFISGAALAQRLSVSRNAVWKAIGALKQEGYKIEASRSGYRMSSFNDMLSVPALKKYLSYPLDIRLLKTVDSTNNAAKLAAHEIDGNGLIIAQEQTAGRGRMGRSFFSPAGCGIYMSIIVHPNITLDKAVMLTAAAAVAVADTISDICGSDARIKWVNDIFINGKKVCGILSEAALSLETGGMDYAIVGIGVNFKEPDGGYPDELKDIVGAVYTDEPADKAAKIKLISGIVNRFLEIYYQLPDTGFIKRYRDLSMLIGKNVTVCGENEFKALVLDIDDACRLVVDSGEKIYKLSSGEVRVRL